MRVFIGSFYNLILTLPDHITNTLYPEVFNGSYGYKTSFDRAALILSEIFITCYTKYLSKGFNNEVYSYLFAMPPAYHGFDNLYTYYDGGAISETDVTVVMNRTVAVVLQQLITSFAKTGVPEAEGVQRSNKYGVDAWMLQLNNGTGFQQVKDKTSASRCSWWLDEGYL